jgi:hypothetical protein
MSDRDCLIDDAYGIYVPQAGISVEDAAVLLAGPDHERYWETWDRVLRNARYTDKDVRVWRLEQDGDLFAWTDDETE